MITPILEKLILRGKAEYRTYQMGGSAVGTLTVPRGNHIVLIDIIWNPFNDSTTFKADPTGAMQDSIHNLRLSSREKIYNYCFRDSFNFTNFGVAPNPYFGNPYQINCFYFFEHDVQIDIMKYDRVTDWAVTFSALPPVANELKAPTAYGNIPVVRALAMGGNSTEYSAVGLQRDPSPIAFTRPRTDFVPDLKNAVTSLNSPHVNLNPYGFPIVTFGYVIINEMPSEFMI